MHCLNGGYKSLPGLFGAMINNNPTNERLSNRERNLPIRKILNFSAPKIRTIVSPFLWYSRNMNKNSFLANKSLHNTYNAIIIQTGGKVQFSLYFVTWKSRFYLRGFKLNCISVPNQPTENQCSSVGMRALAACDHPPFPNFKNAF